jgi:hypothetical protein
MPARSWSSAIGPSVRLTAAGIVSIPTLRSPARMTPSCAPRCAGPGCSALLRVARVVAMSGCPGTLGRFSAPHWSAGAWLPDYETIFAWRWSERILPYQRRQPLTPR